MLVEYVKEYTEGSRRFWSREVELDGKYSHTEKWCVKCEGWRKVLWINGERFCEDCDKNDEAILEAFVIQHDPPSQPLEYYPVVCSCGKCWDIVSPLITRCADCERLASETDEQLRR